MIPISNIILTVVDYTACRDFPSHYIVCSQEQVKRVSLDSSGRALIGYVTLHAKVFFGTGQTLILHIAGTYLYQKAIMYLYMVVLSQIKI